MINHTTISWVCAVLLALCACSDDQTPEQGSPIGPMPEGDVRILVDLIHTTKQNPMLRLQRNMYDYQGMHGYYRLFHHLDTHGYRHAYAGLDDEDARLDDLNALQAFDVLFINLVSSDRPDFTPKERETITEFVRQGGGLFVIADHTNVYYHAERLNPILQPMGIEVLYHTAMDVNPHRAIDGGGGRGAWIKIRSFHGTHPVTRGVEVASFQTGGPLATEHGVAFLSPDGFGDFWQEDPQDLGFYGNWMQDPGEPAGPLPVVAASEFGDGRVVVVGDQNIFGDEWLYIAHNLELASNAFEWLAKREATTHPLREARNPNQFYIGLNLERAQWNIADGAPRNYFPFFINFNRTESIVARGGISLNGREDALVFTNPTQPFSETELQSITSHLDGGKPVVLLADPTRAEPGALQLLRTFAPTLTITTNDGRSFTLNDLPATHEDMRPFYAQEPLPILSDVFDTQGLRMAARHYEAHEHFPEDLERTTPYLYNFTFSSGTSLLQADLNGTTADLARRIPVSNGELIVFLQDGFWRNENLGWERMMPTPQGSADAHEVQYRWLDWMLETFHK